MSNRPLFTIVTICYNSGKTIERTLRSILSQTHTDYEYLIIDGASQDETMNVVREMEPLFKGRLKWLSEKDNGIYDAFNKGIGLASGHFIWLVNSDDQADSNALESLTSLANLLKGQKVIIEGVSRNEQQDGSIKLSTLSTPETRAANYEKKLLGITHPSSVFSREVYEEVGLYDTNYHILGDKDMFIRCYEQGVNFVTLNIPITTMSYGGVSTCLNHKHYLADQWYASRKFGKNCLHTISIFSGIMKMYLRLRYNGLKRRLCG